MIWATDVECAQWDQPVVWGARSERGEERTGDDLESWAEWYFALPSTDTVIARCGGSYDFLCLLSGRPEAEWWGTLAGSRLISLRARGYAELVDSFALLPLSLADLTGAKTTPGLPCVCSRECGGYCSISPDMPDVYRARVRAYCLHDCAIELQAYLRWTEELEALGFAVRTQTGKIRHTIGAVAWETARRTCEIADPPPSPALYGIGQRASYGARVEAYQAYAAEGWYYDLRMAYPWAALFSVPTGARKNLLGRAASAALARQEPGLYEARVWQEAEPLALLPRRSGRRLVWATGWVKGRYPGVELIHAAERGAKIEVLSGLVWEREEPLYKPFIEKVAGVRLGALRRGDQVLATLAKRLGNALVGKLGQGDRVSRLIHTSEWERGDEWLSGRWWIRPGARHVPECARPHQAAYITARVRVAMYERLSSGFGDALQAATDAVYTTRRDPRAVTPEAGQIGDWIERGQLRGFRLLAPGLCRWEEDGSVKVQGRGIPEADGAIFDALERGAEVRFTRGVSPVKTALQRHGAPFVRRDFGRRLASPEVLLGTRYLPPSGSSVGLHFDGREWRWPGVSERPETYREHLPALAVG